MPDLKDIILGNVAIERGLVTRESLLELQKQQRDTGLPLGQVMLRAGLVNGPKLIELMKLVSLTIEHLDGGLEVGADSDDSAGPPPLLVGAANEPSKAPSSRDDIPVVPVVGGGGPSRHQPPRTNSTPMAPAASAMPGGPRTGIPTPKPLPAPVPSPFDPTPRPMPPATRPRTDRFEPARPQGSPQPATPQGYRPKTEAFDFEKVDGYKPKTEAVAAGKPAYKPKTEAPPSAPPPRPKTDRFDAPRPASPAGKPKTARFEAARAGGRTPSEAFRVELASQQKKSDVPEVQGAFGQSLDAGAPQKKDKTRLFAPVALPRETPAGKLPPEQVSAPGTPDEHRISVPPEVREHLAGAPAGASTPAGRLPAGIDAESKAIVSPLDDVKVIPDGAPAFEMPPGAAAQMPPAMGRKSSPPRTSPSRPPSTPSRPPSTPSRPPTVPGTPGSGRIPTAAPEGGRMRGPDDSGFLTESKLPDFEIRASDQPGGKPVIVKNPKAPEPPKKETRKLPGKGPVRPGMKGASAPAGLATAGKAAQEGETKEGEDGEEPKKRSKKLLIVLLVLLALILAGGGVLYYFKKITLLDFQQIPKTIKDAPELFKNPEYWKSIFKF